MKRIKCPETFKQFGNNIPSTRIIDKTFPQYVKGWAYITEDGYPGYAETEEEIIEACENLNQFFGIKTFFLFSSYGYMKADWSMSGALITE